MSLKKPATLVQPFGRSLCDRNSVPRSARAPTEEAHGINDAPFARHLIECMRVRYMNPEFIELTNETKEMEGAFESESDALMSTTGQEFDPRVWLANYGVLPQQMKRQQLLEIDYYIKRMQWGPREVIGTFGGTLLHVLERLALMKCVSSSDLLAPRVKLMIDEMKTSDTYVCKMGRNLHVEAASMEQYITTALYVFNCIFATGARELKFPDLVLAGKERVAVAACEFWALLHLAIPRFNHSFRRAFSSCFVAPDQLPPQVYQYMFAEHIGVITWNALGQYTSITMPAIRVLTGGKTAGGTFLMEKVPSPMTGADIVAMEPVAKQLSISPLALYVTKSLVESEALLQAALAKKTSPL